MKNDPFPMFDSWYAEARQSEINDSNAMALATADAEGKPSVRMVLLKGHGPEGFIFYTNFEGRKANDLLVNPNAALLFHWKSLRRQIRIEGAVGRVDDATADAYFASRSRDSQLGAFASFPAASNSGRIGSIACMSAGFSARMARVVGPAGCSIHDQSQDGGDNSGGIGVR